MTVNGPMTPADRVATLEEAKAQFQKSWDAWKALAKLEEVAESRLARSTNLQNSHSPPQRFAGEVVAHVAQVELDQQIAHLGFRGRDRLFAGCERIRASPFLPGSALFFRLRQRRHAVVRNDADDDTIGDARSAR